MTKEEIKELFKEALREYDLEKKKNKSKPVKRVGNVREFITLTDEQIEKTREKFGVNYEVALDRLNNYKARTGKKYKSDYHALIGWVYDSFKIKGNTMEAIIQSNNEVDKLLGL